mmetsp:Transcript_6804/g.9934  ORF Transcript_6804/g.9934 Transcript_6804/m.9934 type:complete len:207 (+) Transcript_6804:62-682(+)
MTPSSFIFVLLFCSCLSLNLLWKREKKNVSFSNTVVDKDIHDHFMNLALEEARAAAAKGEVPIGALLVKQLEPSPKEKRYRILSRAGNRVERDNDASAHAEMQVLREGAKRVENWRLINTTLYSTLEPCPMCLSACQAFRLPKLVYGARDLRLGAVETHLHLLDVAHPFHNVSTVVNGVSAEESASMLKAFFRNRRLQDRREDKKK